VIFQTIVIHGQTMVKKNSRRVFKQGNFIRNLPSEAFEKWEKKALIELKANYKPVKLNYPIYMHYRIFRQSKHQADLSNLIEGSNDVLQKVGLIAEDNYAHLIPVWYSEYASLEFDKANPRIILTLTDSDFQLKRHTGC
jgi:Holliday junction resolvase RusA-like endonuclease